MLYVSTALASVIRIVFNSSCDCRVFDVGKGFHLTVEPKVLVPPKVKLVNLLGFFMKLKVVLLVSHELSISGNLITGLFFLVLGLFDG
ncbi:hypothetical protein Hanom_Chr15g01369971 [Helianthus anomalus]